MRKAAFVLALVLSIFPCWASAADKYSIQVHLFKGTHAEEQSGLKKIEVLTTSSQPELSSLKDKAPGEDIEFTAAVISALMDVFDLTTVDDLFLHKKSWNGLGKPSLGDMIFAEREFYRVNLSPKELPSQQIAVRLGIFRTEKNPKNPFQGEEGIIERDLVLEVGDPVIVGAPFKGQDYFAVILVKTGALPAAKKRGPQKAEKPKLIELPEPPNPVIRVKPSYPEGLRKRLFGGEIGLRILINEEGAVLGVEVVKPLHPYLNYAAVQAFRQWAFEPVRREGKPVPAVFRYTYEFDPWHAATEEAKSEPAGSEPESSRSSDLTNVLAGCGDYCRKLAGAALDFVCEESIKETHFDLLHNVNWELVVVVPKTGSARGDELFRDRIDESDTVTNQALTKPSIVAAYQVMDPKKTKRRSFVCDYQIIRKAGTVGERRIVLKMDGREIEDRSKTLEERRFSGLSSLIAPLRILAKDQQPRFNFRIIEEDKIGGRKAYVLEAIPKSGDEDGIWSARIWADIKSLQILKCEIQGVPIEGYEDVLNDCVTLNVKPIFVTTHEYGYEKNGVLFPSRSKVHVAYPGINPLPVPKNDISMTYDKYKFFTVQTDSQIIK
jgi:TonB family protein